MKVLAGPFERNCTERRSPSFERCRN